jgi:type II secretory pathway predicted ATPase ExeA/outer membrane protein OmpA-like peptidoglycan-associated protein
MTPHQTQALESELLHYYGFQENPFGVTPDPRYLFASGTHREALAALVCGIECGLGFQALIAKPGMGKTTLLFHLLDHFKSTALTAFLFQTQCTGRELLQYLLAELGGTSQQPSFMELYEQLNEVLARAATEGKRVIVVVDEAQNLDDSVLETLRLVSNFETQSEKLVQIIIAGQPQLARKLASPDQEQLRQRLSTIARIEPLSLEETASYVNHRLTRAGYTGQNLFTPSALELIWELSDGIPRRVNTLCFNAIMLAFADDRKNIDRAVVEEVSGDLSLELLEPELIEPETLPLAAPISAARVETPKVQVKRQNITSDGSHTTAAAVAATVNLSLPNNYGGRVNGSRVHSSKEKTQNKRRRREYSNVERNLLWLSAAIALMALLSGWLFHQRPKHTSRQPLNRIEEVVQRDNMESRNQTAGGELLATSTAETGLRTKPESRTEALAPANAGTVNAIYFDADSSVIRFEYRKTLDRIAEVLRSNPQWMISIEGHTDASGDEIYNTDLSRRRAVAVQRALIWQYHISARRLSAVGLGSGRPLRPNISANDRASNRRVELRVRPVSN